MFSMFETHHLENFHVLSILTSPFLEMLFFPKDDPTLKMNGFSVENFLATFPKIFFSSKLPNVPIWRKRHFQNPTGVGSLREAGGESSKSSLAEPAGVRGNRGEPWTGVSEKSRSMILLMVQKNPEIITSDVQNLKNSGINDRWPIFFPSTLGSDVLRQFCQDFKHLRWLFPPNYPKCR